LYTSLRRSRVADKPGRYDNKEAEAEYLFSKHGLHGVTLKDVAILVPGHGELGTTATIKLQRNYLAAIINGVRDAMGKNIAEAELEKTLDLTKYAPHGANVPHNQVCIRAVYAKLAK